MYTKNPVTGRNETLVNTSMLNGAIDGVATKIAGKADKGALDTLSVYTEGVKTSLAGKADKSAVEEVSAYATGMLPKDVYAPLVDAYVGLACKVADPDVLEGAAKMAFAADPVKYATSNPSDDGCAELNEYKYVEGNPIYDAVTATGSEVAVSALLRLRSVSCSMYGEGAIPLGTPWQTELPRLYDAYLMFYRSGLTSWNTELPNLTSGVCMFRDSQLEEWRVELLNLTSGYEMFYSTHLASFSVALPSLHTAADMFRYCQLDIDSLRCIAEGINDVNVSSVGDHTITIGLSDEAFEHPDKQSYVDLLHLKGWHNVVIS